jgi:hypothetical protein
MKRLAIVVALGAAVVVLARPVRAQSADEYRSGAPADSRSPVEVRSGSEWAATDDIFRYAFPSSRIFSNVTGGRRQSDRVSRARPSGGKQRAA